MTFKRYELYSKRNGDGATWASYIETWSSRLWIAFLLTILLLSVTLYVINKMGMKYKLEDWKINQHRMNCPHNLDDNELDTSFSFCFLSVLGIITNQGFDVNSKTISIRIITVVILFFGLLMLTSYSAVLVSRLAVEKADILFPTLESIAEKSKYSLCVRENNFGYMIFKENESDVNLLPFWQPIVNRAPCENTSTVEDITRALCLDYTVVLESPHVVASILEKGNCVVTRMPGQYRTSYTSLLMRKNFIFKKHINDELKKLITSGVLDFLQKKWLTRRIPKTLGLSTTTNKPVTIDHINGILVVYTIAVFISLIILLIRVIFRKDKIQPTTIPFLK